MGGVSKVFAKTGRSDTLNHYRVKFKGIGIFTIMEENISHSKCMLNL